MNDQRKLEKFCSQVKGEDNEYVNSLKNLSGISDETRKTLIQAIKDYQSKHKSSSGYVESELIKRFLTGNKFIHQKIKEVSGPVFVYQLSHHTYPQIFYLFGDIHVKTEGCRRSIYHIGKWIKDTIINSPVFIDVYVEKPYEYKNYISEDVGKMEIQDSNDFLDILYIFFDECFGKKFAKECETSRFHYVDVRYIFETESQYKGGKEFLFSLEKGIIIRKDEANRREKIKNLISYFNFLKDENSIVYMRIEKQFENIENLHIKKTLKKEFRKCLNENKKYLDKISLLVEYDDVKIDRNILFGLIEFITCLMDYYLMARCFRKFKGDGYSRGSYNNIVYTGGSHTVNCVNILLKLGFNIDFSNHALGEDFQCLNVSKMKQPMFWQRYRN